MKKIVCLILALMTVCALCACGKTAEQGNATEEYLKSYLAGNSFTADGKVYTDYEATQKLFELYTAEGNSEMLKRFTKVENVLLKMEKTVPAGIETTYCHYDSQGILQKTCESTDLTVYFTYHYDEEGRLTEKKQFYMGQAEPAAVCTYKYDKNGSCTRYQDENGKVSTFKWEYDENGKVITGPRVVFMPEGDLVSDTIRYTYTYDAEGRVSNMAGQQTNGKDVSYEFTYDDQGNVVKVIHVMPEGDVTEAYRYENDRLLEKTETLKDGTAAQTYTYGTRYIFDTQGLQ